MSLDLVIVKLAERVAFLEAKIINIEKTQDEMRKTQEEMSLRVRSIERLIQWVVGAATVIICVSQFFIGLYFKK